jgi:hypothetical protein
MHEMSIWPPERSKLHRQNASLPANVFFFHNVTNKNLINFLLEDSSFLRQNAVQLTQSMIYLICYCANDINPLELNSAAKCRVVIICQVDYDYF